MPRLVFVPTARGSPRPRRESARRRGRRADERRAEAPALSRIRHRHAVAVGEDMDVAGLEGLESARQAAP